MQRDCIQKQISASQIPHTQERQIQTTLNTENRQCLKPRALHSGMTGLSLSQV